MSLKSPSGVMSSGDRLWKIINLVLCRRSLYKSLWQEELPANKCHLIFNKTKKTKNWQSLWQPETWVVEMEEGVASEETFVYLLL